MIASQCKALSSALVITAVIVVFCLTWTSGALAQESAQATEDASSRSSAASQHSAGGAGRCKHQFSLDKDQFSFLILVVAFAAYLRLRIEWSKEQIHSRMGLLPMLLVEALIAAVGLMLVLHIVIEPLEWSLPAGFDWTILGAFLLSFVCLICLLVRQFQLDWRWIRAKPTVLPGFLEVEAQVSSGNKRMRIRCADIVTMREGDDAESTVLTLRSYKEITVNKKWDEWEGTREFKP